MESSLLLQGKKNEDNQKRATERRALSTPYRARRHHLTPGNAMFGGRGLLMSLVEMQQRTVNE